jgi:hypothetical protein
MSDEDSIRGTLAQYCQLSDPKQWDDLAKVFSS